MPILVSMLCLMLIPIVDFLVVPSILMHLKNYFGMLGAANLLDYPYFGFPRGGVGLAVPLRLALHLGVL